jgi:hypothetical protein
MVGENVHVLVPKLVQDEEWEGEAGMGRWK